MGQILTPQLGFFLLLLCSCIAEAEYMKYKDPKVPVNLRVKDLLSRMTLDEKIGQMVQIERKVASADVMKNYFIGSVLSGGGSVPGPKASAEAWVNMVNDFQKGALSTRLGIPYIYGIDAVHGHNNVYNATIFPHNVGLGVTRDPELVKRIGAATALEVRATGIPYSFAPCIAVCRNPRWGRCYESYSEDHSIVQMMTEIIPGLQGDVPADYPKGFPYIAGKNKVAGCAKHFVGDGGTQKGINENNTLISLKGLLDIHMPAYLDSIKKGVATVMVSYSSWNGVKMHANRNLVTGFLKNKLKFRGFVISDWEGIDRITSPPHANYTYSVLAGVQAGIDMFNPVDDRYFISGSLDAKVRIWSIPDRQVVDWNDLHEMVTAACYTPDGQGALVGSYKGSCCLYNTSENKLQQKSHINLQNQTKKSHLKKITGFQFVPGSSSEVLITSADSRVRVVNGIDLVHKFRGFRNRNSQISASVTANGKYVVCASEDSHVYIWRHEGESRPSRSKSVKDTRTYEHFHCKDVCVAIPWPGMNESWDPPDLFSGQERLSGHQPEYVSKGNHPPTPVEEFTGNESSSTSTSRYGNSPFRSTVSSAQNGYFFDRISATWPEENLLLPTMKRSPRPSLDFSNGVLQNHSAWGIVIVTAGLRGEIRTFQNFGLPVRT